MLFLGNTGVTWPYVIGPIAAVCIFIWGIVRYQDGNHVTGIFLLALSPVVLLFVFWMLLYFFYAIFGVVILFLILAALFG